MKKAGPDSARHELVSGLLKNQHLFFVHASLDDRCIPSHAFRILFHLHRRIANGDPTKNPGIRRMATICRMEKKRVILALKWLDAYGFIKISRTPGKGHKYQLICDKALFCRYSPV